MVRHPPGSGGGGSIRTKASGHSSCLLAQAGADAETVEWARLIGNPEDRRKAAQSYISLKRRSC
jgi:hypothetical protein